MSTTPKAALRMLLVANGTISAAIGARVYTRYAAQDAAFPLAVIYEKTVERVRHMAGVAGIAQAVIILEWYADTDAELETLSEAARGALDMYSNTVTVGSDTIDLRSVTLADESETFEMPADGGGAPVKRKSQEWQVWYRE